MREIRTLRARWRGLETWCGSGPRATPARQPSTRCGNGAMAEPLRHRQTKEAATDMLYLTPPRHISTLPMLSKKSKIERLRKSREDQFFVVAAACPYRKLNPVGEQRRIG